MDIVPIDDYNSVCTMIVNGKETEFKFCRNDYDITFIYIDGELFCIFIPEFITNTKKDIADDIKRLYGSELPIITLGYLHEQSFCYGMMIGMTLVGEPLNVD